MHDVLVMCKKIRVHDPYYTVLYYYANCLHALVYYHNNNRLL